MRAGGALWAEMFAADLLSAIQAVFRSHARPLTVADVKASMPRHLARTGLYEQAKRSYVGRSEVRLKWISLQLHEAIELGAMRKESSAKGWRFDALAGFLDLLCDANGALYVGGKEMVSSWNYIHNPYSLSGQAKEITVPY